MFRVPRRCREKEVYYFAHYFFFQHVDCDLKFDNENAFQIHANSRNPAAAASVMSKGEFLPVPRGPASVSVAMKSLKDIKVGNKKKYQQQKHPHRSNIKHRVT